MPLNKETKQFYCLGGTINIWAACQYGGSLRFVELLGAVLQFYCGCCVIDSFRFASMIRQLTYCMVTKLIVSFNISSLFINILLGATIIICAACLYDGHLRLVELLGVVLQFYSSCYVIDCSPTSFRTRL